MPDERLPELDPAGGKVPSGRVPKNCGDSLVAMCAGLDPLPEGKFSWPEADQVADGEEAAEPSPAEPSAVCGAFELG